MHEVKNGEKKLSERKKQIHGRACRIQISDRQRRYQLLFGNGEKRNGGS